MQATTQYAEPRPATGREANHQPRGILNGGLWTVQTLWGVFFAFTGFGKVLCVSDAVWNQMLPRVPWFSAVPQPLFVFIGLCEFLGGAGLILPAMTGIKPKLTPLAGMGLALVMVLAAGFHTLRGEYSFYLITNLVLGAGPAFVAYGRLLVRPVEPAPTGAFRVTAGLAVLVALVCAGWFPVWYQMTHTH